MTKKGIKSKKKDNMLNMSQTLSKGEKEVEKVVKDRVGEGKEMVVSVLDKMNTLFTSGMGLVAALAWNDAVKNLFDQVFAQNDKNSIWAMFGYAVVVTIIVVMITFRLTKLIEKIKKKDEKEAEKKKN